MSARSQGEPSSSTLGILAHPAMFGKKWTPNITARLYIVPWDEDLCNETIGLPEYLESVAEVNTTVVDQKQYEVALYYDPLERQLGYPGKKECRNATMAQVAEKKYPTAKYLLVANTDMVPMTKTKDEPDPQRLALGTVTVEVGSAIRSRLHNATIATGPILVTIDGTSRSLLDVNSAFEEYIDTGPDIWTTTIQITGSISFIGSLYVLASLIGTKERRSKNLRVPFNRLLLSISIADLMSSLGMILAGWLIPATPPGDYEGNYSVERWKLNFPRAIGNQGTCKAQAFFIHVGLSASAFFTGYVALQTLLVVRYAWTEKQMKKAEYFFFASGLGVPIITVIWAGAKGLFNPMEVGFCWISQQAMDVCDQEGGPLLDDYCEGVIPKSEILVYQVVFGMAWIILALFGILYSMISLYIFVRRRERQAARWSTNAQEGRQQKRVLTKSLAIIGAYFFTWIPTIVSLIPATALAKYPVIMNTIVAAVLPLQGFFNALIFSGLAEKCCSRSCLYH